MQNSENCRTSQILVLINHLSHSLSLYCSSIVLIRLIIILPDCCCCCVIAIVVYNHELKENWPLRNQR